MNISPEAQPDIPASLKTRKPFAVWFSCLVCLFYALKYTGFLFSHHFYLLVFNLAFSYVAVAVSLFLFSRASILFAVINLGMWAYVFLDGYRVYGVWSLGSVFVLQQIFHLWLVIYTVYLYKKGLLK